MAVETTYEIKGKISNMKIENCGAVTAPSGIYIIGPRDENPPWDTPIGLAYKITITIESERDGRKYILTYSRAPSPGFPLQKGDPIKVIYKEIKEEGENEHKILEIKSEKEGFTFHLKDETGKLLSRYYHLEFGDEE